MFSNWVFLKIGIMVLAECKHGQNTVSSFGALLWHEIPDSSFTMISPAITVLVPSSESDLMLREERHALLSYNCFRHSAYILGGLKYSHFFPGSYYFVNLQLIRSCLFRIDFWRVINLLSQQCLWLKTTLSYNDNMKDDSGIVKLGNFFLVQLEKRHRGSLHLEWLYRMCVKTICGWLEKGCYFPYTKRKMFHRKNEMYNCKL